MKMGLYPMFRKRRSERRGNFGYVRGKGFKTENIVDYTLQKKMVFSGKLTPDRANEKHIALSPR
jgi:hypothetical protein